jgi:hypothetical protein
VTKPRKNLLAMLTWKSGLRRRRVAERLSMSALIWVVFAIPSLGQNLGSSYVSAADAPPSWAQFSKLIKYRFETWIGASDPVANRLRAYLTKRAGQDDSPPQTLEVHAWVNPDGTIERVSFSPLNNAQADADLHTILRRGNVGEAPPPEMLQPLRLRFSLKSKK